MWKKEPFVIQVKAGKKKNFCMCGDSEKPPLCDGSHAGTGKSPKGIRFEKDETIYACGCQKSGRIPFCDGTHERL